MDDIGGKYSITGSNGELKPILDILDLERILASPFSPIVTPSNKRQQLPTNIETNAPDGVMRAQATSKFPRNVSTVKQCKLSQQSK